MAYTISDDCIYFKYDAECYIASASHIETEQACQV